MQATLLINSGAGIKTVQHLLGHSSANLTMHIYAHPIEQNDRAAANAIGRILAGGGSPSKSPGKGGRDLERTAQIQLMHRPFTDLCYYFVLLMSN